MVAFALTLNALSFTVLGSWVHASYTPLALVVTGVGIFVTTWFLLDVGISLTADLQRRRQSRHP